MAEVKSEKLKLGSKPCVGFSPFFFLSLTRTLTTSKVLSLENPQIDLVFCSLIRTFAGEIENIH